MRLQLVDDARRAWRHFSTIALAISSGILGAWAMMPDDLKASLPPGTPAIVAKVLLVVTVWGLIGKFLKQPLREPKATADPKGE